MASKNIRIVVVFKIGVSVKWFPLWFGVNSSFCRAISPGLET